MKITKTNLPGVLILEPRLFSDSRGYFKVTYNADHYLQQAGIDYAFVQDNQSYSVEGVLRGLHFQKNHPQGKLISVNNGSIFDVVVDIDPNSPSFTQHLSIEISATNHRQVWIPPGYAHGYCVLDGKADISYKCTDYYHPEDEAGLAWDCPRLNIPWPIVKPLLSKKDQANPNVEQWLAQQGQC